MPTEKIPASSRAREAYFLGVGLEPDLDRGRLATPVDMLRRNGRASLRPKRGRRSAP